MSGTIIDDGGVASKHRAAIGAAVSKRLSRNPMTSRIETPKLEIYGRHAFLSVQECAALRAQIDAGAKPSTLFAGSPDSDPSYRTSSTCNLNAHDPLVAAIDQRIAGLMALDRATGETLQGQRYGQGQEYRAHCDFFPVTSSYWPDMRASGGQRCWTAMIYLNDVERGGETHFPYCEFKVPPKEGMVLIWNNLLSDGAPNDNSLHAALPVEAGMKYVVTKWFRERPWSPARKLT